MIHHVSLGTNDVLRARRFYEPLLDLLGLRLLRAGEDAVHFGTGDILFSVVAPTDGQPACGGNGTHVAFMARDRAMVAQFHELAIQHGGRSDGDAGIRAQYGRNYFAAFVFDPDGNKIEGVTHSAE
jgi:catechol 2,3-dioxygenase-like lactoylglutathione lyase family enzyme